MAKMVHTACYKVGLSLIIRYKSHADLQFAKLNKNAHHSLITQSVGLKILQTQQIFHHNLQFSKLNKGKQIISKYGCVCVCMRVEEGGGGGGGGGGGVLRGGGKRKK